MKILINGITFEDAILHPLVNNCNYWITKGGRIIVLGNLQLSDNLWWAGLKKYRLIEVCETHPMKNKWQLIVEGLRRNLQILRQMHYLKREMFDIVYTQSSVLDLVILPYFLKKADKRVRWATVFDNAVSLYNFWAWVFFKISLILLKKADVIFTVTEDLKQYLLRRGFKNVIVTGNGVEVELIRNAQKKDYNIDGLYVGRINRRKGVFDLLKITAFIQDFFPDFQLAIMGTGDDKTVNKFKRAIQKYKLTSNVRLLGYVEGQEKYDIIKSSKMFIFPSWEESFGLALLEAVCSGIKSFAYCIKPYKELYKDYEVVLVDYWEQMAIQILNTFDSKDFNNDRGKLLLDKYNWERIADAEYEVFRVLRDTRD